MRNRWHKTHSFVNALLLTTLLATAGASSALADAIQWAPDLQTAQAQASRQGRLVLVHFWADDCPPCRRLEANVFSRPEVAQAISSKFVPVKVHAKRRSDLSRRFGVDRWPTDVVITPSGQKITSMVSPQDPQQYVQTFTQIASRQMAPIPPAQTAGLAPQQPGQPYSNAYTKNNPAAAAASQAPSRYAPSPSPAQAPNNAPWNANAAAGNSRAGNPPSAVAPQAAATAGSAYGSRYQAAQAGYGEQNRFDYNPPAGNAAPSQSQPGGSLATAPQPQGAAYQPRYANQAASPEQHSAVSEPMPKSQSTNNPYANLGQNQAPGQAVAPPAGSRYGQPAAQVAANPQGNQQRRQVWEWNNENQQPRPDASAQAGPRPAMPSQQQAPAQPEPSQQAAAPRQAPPQGAPPQASGHPPIAIDGYCPVALNGNSPAWVKGDERYGAVHRGRTYLFSSAQAQQTFLQDPDRYAPALSGYDPVRFVEEKKVVPGTRAFGWFYKDRYYLFADEAGLRRFEKSPDMYHGVVQQAMQGGPGQQQAPQGTEYR